MPRQKRSEPAKPMSRLLTPDQAKALLGVDSDRYLKVLRDNRSVTYVLVGRQARYDEASLLAWIESRTRGAAS